ncbi:transposon tf2-11 polyprotein [Plakobranchus ocellatus]|uniref:Transposon tf2-11 polyprotein n=1 Tax=Plakobranchus ocellatus TaxID=259542 RepID=A0AAV3ZJN7_9GAST|nr:transposon tf2-11 polyprotein [Plakobranchus ocellatus]
MVRRLEHTVICTIKMVCTHIVPTDLYALANAAWKEKILTYRGHLSAHQLLKPQLPYDVFSKFQCIHIWPPFQTSLLPANWTGTLLQFGYSHAIVTDNVVCFSYAEFQIWREQRDIQHMHEASQHPGSNGAA